MNDINSLAHSKWRCQYHIVFAPKYRRQEVYGKIKADIGAALTAIGDGDLPPAVDRVGSFCHSVSLQMKKGAAFATP